MGFVSFAVEGKFGKTSKIQQSFLGWNLLYFLKKAPNANLKLEIDPSEKIGKAVSK